MTVTETAPLLTTTEVCARLGCHRNTLARYVTLGMISPIRINQRRLRYRAGDVEQLLAGEMTDMAVIAGAYKLMAETRATEERPLCSNCGRRRVNRGHSFCTSCEQTLEAQLENKRRWWDRNNAPRNEAKRADRARHKETTMADQPEQPTPDDQKSTEQPTKRMPMRTAVPPKERDR